MNKRQTEVLLLGIATLVLVLLYPPWVFEFTAPPRGPKYADAGFSILFSPPPVPITSRSGDGKEEYFLGEYRRSWVSRINYQRLLAPIAIVVLICGGLLAASRESKGQK